jgi:hypothetical protein
MRTWYGRCGRDVVGVVYASQGAKAGVCWVVRETERPLNIVFSAGSSEDNAVAWREPLKGNPCARLADGGKIVTCDLFRLPVRSPPQRGRGVTCSQGPLS